MGSGQGVAVSQTKYWLPKAAKWASMLPEMANSIHSKVHNMWDVIDGSTQCTIRFEHQGMVCGLGMEMSGRRHHALSGSGFVVTVPLVCGPSRCGSCATIMAVAAL